MKKNWLMLSVLFAVMLVLAACSGDKEGAKDEGDKEKTSKTEETVDTSALPLEVTNEGETIKGGTLQVGLVTNTPFQGIFNWELYEDAYDAEIMNFATNVLFELDGDFNVNDKGIAKLDVDVENLKAKVTIQQDVKWSDGTPLTADDLIYPYEIIGHPDYEGFRFDGDFRNIVGAEEYNAGKAETISGIKKLDEKSIEITFKKLSPAIYSIGDGLWGYAAPKHQLESIAVKDLLASDAVRKNPVTLGAFKFDKIVNGESVQFVANEHYWKGKPKLEKVVVQTVHPSSISEALKAGKFDIALSYPTNQYDGVKDLSNISVLGRDELAIFLYGL